MNPIRGTRLLAGVEVSDTVRQELTATADKSEDDTSLRIEEPLRFHLARYEHLTQCLHGKCHLAAALLSGLVLTGLGWKAHCGEFISPERWLCGALSGWFIVAMIRLAVFTCLAAPRFICYTPGKLQVSGLGTLRAEQILRWSIEHKVIVHSCARPCAKFHLCCRRLGSQRQWTMLMEEGRETERFERLLEAQLPCTPTVLVQPLRPTIQIEAGVLSQ